MSGELMIIHKLIIHHLKHGDDERFYAIQARSAIHWLLKNGVSLNETTEALDLGCGHGIFGSELKKAGCRITFADQENFLLPELKKEAFIAVDLDKEALKKLGNYNLIVCSNVLEHLANPERFLRGIPLALRPEGYFYLSWTNWLSPWGGHEFSPFHYLGAHRGHLLWDKTVKRTRKHTPFQNLFPTSISQTLRWLASIPELELLRVVPRYYPEFAFLCRLPAFREILTWNCAILIRRKS
jgi:2-polyprenyl-3-methyl-5-hydroxy-6-metoxy-1,4-benzoquinol methylase